MTESQTALALSRLFTGLAKSAKADGQTKEAKTFTKVATRLKAKAEALQVAENNQAFSDSSCSPTPDC